MSRGKLVVFEGMDGSGKSTLAQAVEELLVAMMVPVLLTGFPSKSGAIGQFIRQSFQGKVSFDRRAYLYLMIADGLDWENRIIDFVTQGGIFIADRHNTFSTFVYQTEDFPEEIVEMAYRINKWLVPDMAFLVDVPVEVALQRQQGRKKQVDLIWEKDDYVYNSRIRSKYLSLFARHEGPTTVLDGTLDTQILVKQVIAALGISP